MANSLNREHRSKWTNLKVMRQDLDKAFLRIFELEERLKTVEHATHTRSFEDNRFNKR